MELLGILRIIFLFVLLLASLRGALIYRKTDAGYRPMLIFVWMVFLLNTVRFLSGKDDFIGTLASDLLPPIELLLISWQIRRWKVFEIRPLFSWALLVGAPMLWSAEQMTARNDMHEVNMFNLFSSFLITLLGIEALTRSLINTKGRLRHNPAIPFSIALIIYFSFTGLVEMFMLTGKSFGPPFYYKTACMSLVIGTITNFIYLYSIVCIPTKTNTSTFS